MIEGRKDYKELLYRFGDLLHEYHVYADGTILDKDDKKVDDENIIIFVRFFLKYFEAFHKFDELKEEKKIEMDRCFIERVINCHGIFNSLINTCVSEYRVYDDIGTGNVTYAPYQLFADYFFTDEGNKEILIDFLNTELSDIFHIEKKHGRVR